MVPFVVVFGLKILRTDWSRFSPSLDGSIEGGHRDPYNGPYWHVGCLGITPPCSLECKAAFLECIETKVWVDDTRKDTYE